MTREGARGYAVTRQASPAWGVLPPEQESLRPLYARMLGLRHVNPGGLLCFVYFEGAISLAVLLGLAELVSWWAVLLLPASVAAMVKVNDEVAAAVARSAARIPQVERERLRRELEPAIGRARVPEAITTLPIRPAGLPPPTARSYPVRRRGGWLSVIWARRKLSIGLPKINELALDPPDEPTDQPEPSTDERAEPVRTQLPEPGLLDRPYQPKRCPLNSGPLERLDRPPLWQWPAGLDEPDSPRQRNRQSGKRRYK